MKEESNSERLLHELVLGVTDYAIFLLDPDGNIASWNAGAERLKGYDSSEIIGRHFSIFYTAEAVSAGWPAHELATAAATGRFEDEGWRVRKDGSRFWANVVITALRDDATGSVRGFLKITRDLSERKRAEESALQLLHEEAARGAAEATAREARRQREQYRVTLASIGDGVIVADPRGVITFINPVAEHLTGWPALEAIGQPLAAVFTIVNEATRAPVESPFEKVLRDGSVVGLANHTLLLSRDGRAIAIDDSGAPIHGEDGGIVGIVLVFRDVTETRRAVEARLHLAAIVESSEDAIISKTLDGIIVSWNRGAERLYGYRAGEIIGQPLTLLVPPEQPDELSSLMERIRRGERVEHFETVRVRKDGTRVAVSLAISPVRDAAGNIVGASKIARDISAAKRAEAGLRFLADASRLLFEVQDVRSALQNVASTAVPGFADWCAVDLLEEDGSLARIGLAHVDPQRVVLARGLGERSPSDPGAPTGLWNILRTGRSEACPDVPAAVLGGTIRDRDVLGGALALGVKAYVGVPIALRGMTHGVITFASASPGAFSPGDVTLAEELGRRAATALENSRLYRELQAADRRKDEFLAMLSHELRNPLAPIRMALQVMRAPGAGPEEVDRARAITERQVRHLSRLVDDLLDASRILRGRIELQREPLDLASVMANAVETAAPAADAQGQVLIVEPPSEPLHVGGDRTRLVQVISNLLHNAAKFSPRAGRIWLTGAREGDDAVIRVRDEGAGIRADLLPRIFDLFSQGDRSLERSQGGLGIGLTLVRQLVELHGGRVTAASAGPGRGSEFTIRLPLLRETAPAAKVTRTVTASPPRRILVVDDNVDAAESVSMMLVLWGHDVRVAHNGADALRVADEHRPEIILLDIGLPGMSGYEVARVLQRGPRPTRATLVAVTGYGQESDRRRSRDAGFDHHLTKPVDEAVLHRIVASAGGGRRGA